MSRLLLTSCGFITEDIKNQFLDFMDRDLSRLKVSIITTGSPMKENNRYAQRAMQDFKDMGFQHIDFVDIEFDDPQILVHRDVIYINGGNPFTLLYYAKKSGADEIIKTLAAQNVIIVGVSAGALLLGPNINIVDFFTPQMNTMDLTDFKALGVTDKLIFPHYDREDKFKDRTNKTIEERIVEFESNENCKVTRLKEEEYISIVTNQAQ
ncbi:Type 1 glutamine amidotransferase-like domain-containing protein [Paenibacillus silvae]|uniref:Type 1 glutamine amidotransferase-like domain-containing protein n=1 Tax=Paenibacillus silvae TaxID=1325358 RepID=UPI002003FB47|nr:Type 1 glutamine amidotransferase-like domain-containing protein [Paenibacillus silvae]MCK6073912.1 Type 1 glutamine amidotransferase-like domain-containing protein [Paenibacillus silvae]MCK6148611.1 Type 1 glutamine amidotransferase-like domain-containing protein [Paenibacillus silvae]MCK6266912.1 Type 1 glutamine amidotransferase-like domain-containing protein [Paenibacillus silvae]